MQCNILLRTMLLLHFSKTHSKRDTENDISGNTQETLQRHSRRHSGQAKATIIDGVAAYEHRESFRTHSRIILESPKSRSSTRVSENEHVETLWDTLKSRQPRTSIGIIDNEETTCRVINASFTLETPGKGESHDPRQWSLKVSIGRHWDNTHKTFGKAESHVLR